MPQSPQSGTRTRDLLGYAGSPPDPRWPGGARVAVSLVVNFEEGAEFSVTHGDPENEAVYEIEQRLAGRSDPARRRLIRPFDLNPNGSLARQSDRVFADLGGPEPGVPDGMKVDTEGNVYCGGAGGIWIMDPKGKKLGRIVHGAPATTTFPLAATIGKPSISPAATISARSTSRSPASRCRSQKIAARLCPGGWSRHTAARIERKFTSAPRISLVVQSSSGGSFSESVD
jgi:hypothetical protein